MSSIVEPSQVSGFRHEAIRYRGRADFLDWTTRFVGDALGHGEPVLIIVPTEKIDALRSALGDRAASVGFADMSDVGRNPARLVSLWVDFVAEHGATDRRCRGVGEPVWSGRTPEEAVECARNEALLNIAFADAPPFWLACPYDATTLGADVLERARATHPLVREGSDVAYPQPSRSYAGLDAAGGASADLEPTPPRADEMRFGTEDLAAVRAFVDERSDGLDPGRAADLIVAVNELAANTIRHGGGSGTLRVWNDARSIVCEVADGGWISNPLAGRVRPEPGGGSGCGLWLVNQLCDLTQVRSSPTGTVVRLHMTADRASPGLPRRRSGNRHIRDAVATTEETNA